MGQDQSKIESPCVRNCCLNEYDVCLGCFRTLTEIKQWTLVDDAMRLIYLSEAVKRKVANKG